MMPSEHGNLNSKVWANGNNLYFQTQYSLGARLVPVDRQSWQTKFKIFKPAIVLLIVIVVPKEL